MSLFLSETRVPFLRLLSAFSAHFAAGFFVKFPTYSKLKYNDLSLYTICYILKEKTAISWILGFAADSEAQCGTAADPERLWWNFRTFLLTNRLCCAILSLAESHAGIAQSVEQLIRNQQVVCSSHITSSIKSKQKEDETI